MKRSLEALTRELVDYAGMFPPASLPLEQSLENYLTYRKGGDRGLLGRFICPAGRLEEAVAFLEPREEEAVEFSVLLQGPTLHEVLPEIQRVRTLTEGSLIEVGAFECRLDDRPPALTEVELSRYLNRVASRIGDLGFDSPLFFEPPLKDWQQRWPHLWETAHQLNQSVGGSRRPSLGFKLRCGGPDASFVPSLEQVAHALVGTRAANLKMKATAGLHHALRHFDQSLQTQLHGFVSLFGAGVLSDVHQLAPHETLEILSEENPDAFRFEDDGFSWGSWGAELNQIEAARQRLFSFGSCSFDEPCQEVAALAPLQTPNQ